jgi:hypothetical protein
LINKTGKLGSNNVEFAYNMPSFQNKFDAYLINKAEKLSLNNIVIVGNTPSFKKNLTNIYYKLDLYIRILLSSTACRHKIGADNHAIKQHICTPPATKEANCQEESLCYRTVAGSDFCNRSIHYRCMFLKFNCYINQIFAKFALKT